MGDRLGKTAQLCLPALGMPLVLVSTAWKGAWTSLMSQETIAKVSGKTVDKSKQLSTLKNEGNMDRKRTDPMNENSCSGLQIV